MSYFNLGFLRLDHKENHNTFNVQKQTQKTKEDEEIYTYSQKSTQTQMM